MRQFNISRGIKGWKTLENYVIRFKYMISEEAQRKAKILTFWQKHGLKATIDAYETKRSTLYLWKKKLRKDKGKLESLNNQSKKPKTVRKRRTDYRIEEEIIKQRKEHPKLGKEKISVLLKSFCQKNNIKYQYSFSTTGRILKDLKNRDMLPTYTKMSLYGKTGVVKERKQAKIHKKLRIKDYEPKEDDNLVQVDTVVYFINGIRRYIVTAINPQTDFSFAYAYQTPSSENTRDFFKKLQSVAPFKITHAQTDNGSEFAKYFSQYMSDQNIVHFHNYPRCPKMNAYVERFNRTIQEEFANWHRLTLACDIDLFNRKLMDWLIWYNTERPHWSLGFLSPLQFIIKKLNVGESNMLWTDTTT